MGPLLVEPSEGRGSKAEGLGEAVASILAVNEQTPIVALGKSSIRPPRNLTHKVKPGFIRDEVAGPIILSA